MKDIAYFKKLAHQLMFDLSDDEAKDILNLVRATTVRVKRNLFDKELVSLYKQYKEKEQ